MVLISGLLVYGVVAGLRRTLANRRDRLPATVAQPPPCVTVQWFGEERSRRAHPSGSAREEPVHVRLVAENGVAVDRPARRVGRALDYIPLPKA